MGQPRSIETSESIGATLFLFAASSLALVSCDKEKPATETPAGEEPAMSDEPMPGDAEPLRLH